ncbi:MAG TPA: bifunctional 4-hydroxy-2-oxoglutarate aldolase/2-dehydro-3-deoxy-phosphogluconate aldolase [Polyangiaceae bacterium]|nr:bifunctional 4-hydroxy-2-oxoglutarate aldolase/2-dehydro-3-deoxy-phosphogluconate aldolase [Polyangiaceae bacterium]
MNDVFERLRACRVVPVVKLPNTECAEGLGRALVAGGLPCIEVTFRSAAAEGAIRSLSRSPELLVGAGTIRSLDQARAAKRAGAQFLVSPALREDVVKFALDEGLPVSPGVCTPSEVEQALDLGATVLKFFPAESFGGIGTLKALSAVYPDVPFIPTGGINADNLARYLALGNVLACGGSWLAETALLSEGRFDEIERRARQAASIAGSRAFGADAAR